MFIYIYMFKDIQVILEKISLYCETKRIMLICKVHCIMFNFIYIFILLFLMHHLKLLKQFQIKVKYWVCIFTSSLAKDFSLKKKKRIVYPWLGKMVSMLDWPLIKFSCRLAQGNYKKKKFIICKYKCFISYKKKTRKRNRFLAKTNVQKNIRQLLQIKCEPCGLQKTTSSSKVFSSSYRFYANDSLSL